MKNKLESEHKTQMVKLVQGVGGYARRFEDQYSVGTPDCVFILPQRVPVFAEVKRFTGNVFQPTPRQWVELDRIQKSSTKVAAAVIGVRFHDKILTYYIANNQHVVDIRYTTVWSNRDFIAALEKFLE